MSREKFEILLHVNSSNVGLFFQWSFKGRRAGSIFCLSTNRSVVIPNRVSRKWLSSCWMGYRDTDCYGEDLKITMWVSVKSSRRDGGK